MYLKILKVNFFVLVALGVFLSCVQQVENSIVNKPNKQKKPKNVILVIGDGMGMSQIYSAITTLKGKSAFQKFPITGNSITYSADHYITDSGAGGTALSTGKKTNNSQIAIDPKGDTLKTIIELAKDKEMSAGVVATSYVAHATPASFVCHNINRLNYEEIALDYLKSDIDVFIGGGRDHFNKRKDSIDLIKKLIEKGYFVVDTITNLKNIDYSKKVAGLMYAGHPPKISENRGDMLQQSTKVAIDKLSQNSNGYFLMVEASQIDWGGHDNNLDYIIKETIDLNNLLEDLIKYSNKNDSTLIIVTADHETGGLTLTSGSIENSTVGGKFSTIGHSATPVPVFAIGPGCELFSGIYDNTQIFEKIKNLLDL